MVDLSDDEDFSCDEEIFPVFNSEDFVRFDSVLLDFSDEDCSCDEEMSVFSECEGFSLL